MDENNSNQDEKRSEDQQPSDEAQAELREISEEELKKILGDHKKWLESDGEEGKKAELKETNLKKANLKDASLQNDGCNEPWPVKTNPLSSDTDNDGFNDSYEWIYLGGTNPVSLDADADGISNDNEHNYFKTICNDSDTDNDALEDGFELEYFKSQYSLTDLQVNTSGYLLDSDSDDDGLIDGLEYFLGSDLLDNDTDNDNLSDYDEFILGTNLLIPDTENDGLLDGDEVHTFKTSPFLQDTDNDGLRDIIEVYEQNMTILKIGYIDGIFTNASDPDSDDDGILDGEEVFGWHWGLDRRVPEGGTTDDIIPVWEDEQGNLTLNPYFVFPDPYRARFQTNPMNADTDGDGLPDGKEKDLTLSPVTDDTDGDGLIDSHEYEMMVNYFGTEDLSVLSDIWHYFDYDSDGLTDWDEYHNGTNIRAPDSDSDGLSDWEELTMPILFSETETERIGDDLAFVPANVTGIRKYTDPMNPDSDGDGLLDGDEINVYGTDPLDNDTDHDGLTDYAELISLNTSMTGIDGTYFVHPDPTNPDSDNDGINDGEEFLEYEGRYFQTNIPQYRAQADFDNDFLINILDFDSDNDGISDGIEIYHYTNSSWPWYPIGTDPFNADQDANSIPDGYQTDFDGDGLYDYQETLLPAPGYSQPVYLKLNGSNALTYQHIINHTLFAQEDTDGDGYTDGDEVNTYFTDPLDVASAPFVRIETLDWYGTDYTLNFFTQSIISNVNFYQEAKEVAFTVSGEDGTEGACEITIPRGLLDAPNPTDWVVYMDGEPIDFSASISDQSTSFYFTYNHSAHEIVIKGITAVEIPEEPLSTTTTTAEKSSTGWSLWILLVAIVSFVPLSKRKKKNKK